LDCHAAPTALYVVWIAVFRLRTQKWNGDHEVGAA